MPKKSIAFMTKSIFTLALVSQSINAAEEEISLHNIPQELQEKIISELSERNKLTLSEVCKQFKDVRYKFTTEFKDLQGIFFTTMPAVPNEELSKYTNLTRLNLANNVKITEDTLTSLTKIRSLDLSGSKIITGNTLSLLTNITALNLYDIVV